MQAKQTQFCVIEQIKRLTVVMFKKAKKIDIFNCHVDGLNI